MTTPLELVRDADICSLTFLALLLLAIGHRFLAQSPALHERARRLAAAVFLAFCVYGAFVYSPYEPSDWILIILRALVAGLLTLGLASIILPTLAFLKRTALNAPLQKLRHTRHSAQQRCQEPVCQHDHEDLARIQAQRERDARSAQLQRHQAEVEAARRRTNARAELELRFSLLAPKLQERFTKQMLADYITTYMADDHSSEDVERRGRDLIATLETHVQEQEVAATILDLDQFDAWFQTQKQQIQGSSADEKLKRRLLVSLNVRYEELTQKLMENLEP